MNALDGDRIELDPEIKTRADIDKIKADAVSALTLITDNFNAKSAVYQGIIDDCDTKLGLLNTERDR